MSFFFILQLEEYEIKLTAYAEKIIKLTVEIETMEKNPDDYNDANFDDVKVEIKQVEALIKELQVSISGSTTVFESLRVEVSSADRSHCLDRVSVLLNPLAIPQITIMDETLTRLEKSYDKNLVLATRREYIKVQLQLEECERRHDELFSPNIGKFIYTPCLIQSSKGVV